MRHALRMGAALGCVALIALVQSASAAKPRQPVRLYTLNCGEMQMSDIDSLADDGSLAKVARRLSNPCFLIRHPKGDLIWDTGFPESIQSRPDGARSGVYHVWMRQTLTKQLEQIGLKPADIEFASLSHSHFDHTGNVSLFSNATWLIDSNEWSWMFRDAAKADEDFEYVAPLQNFKVRQIATANGYDVFGDGTVKIVGIPGHTPGHAMIRLKLKRHGTVLLTGDLWHLSESRERRLVPRFNSDRAQTLASMDKVNAIAKSRSVRVVQQHVPEDIAMLPAFPGSLD